MKFCSKKKIDQWITWGLVGGGVVVWLTLYFILPLHMDNMDTVQDIVGHDRSTLTGSPYSGKSTFEIQRDAINKLAAINVCFTLESGHFSAPAFMSAFDP